MLDRRYLLVLWLLTVGCGGAPQGLRVDPVPVKPTFQTALDRPVCVVLSVGAQHGLAHLGALRVAVDEADLRVTCIAGSSMGALVGSLYATNPGADPVERYREFFEQYRRAGQDEAWTRGIFVALLGLATGGATLVAAGAAVGAASVSEVSYVRFVDTLDTFYEWAEIQELPVQYVNFHQRLGIDGVLNVTARTGNLAKQVGASIANPLLFKEIKLGEGSELDPGLDRTLRTPIQDTCEEFPESRILAFNVTGDRAFYLPDIPCPVLEVMIPKMNTPPDALDPRAPAFDEVVQHGHDIARRELAAAGIIDGD